MQICKTTVTWKTSLLIAWSGTWLLQCSQIAISSCCYQTTCSRANIGGSLLFQKLCCRETFSYIMLVVLFFSLSLFCYNHIPTIFLSIQKEKIICRMQQSLGKVTATRSYNFNSHKFLGCTGLSENRDLYWYHILCHNYSAATSIKVIDFQGSWLLCHQE